MKNTQIQKKNPLTAITLVISLLALTLGVAAWVRLDQLSDQQLKTDLVNSFKNNYTQAQLNNLRNCFAHGDTECPDDKYSNSTNWRNQIDTLIK